MSERIGIIGAGVMGSGIAQLAVQSGYEVILTDTMPQQLELAVSRITAGLDAGVKRGFVEASTRDRALGNLEVTSRLDEVAQAVVIIENIWEDQSDKHRLFEELDHLSPESSIFASNTSTLPITSLAETSQRPANFIGLHFFSPVHRMKLVEIIRGEQTSDACLASAMDFVEAIGKTPIVVNDGRGFYTSRVFGTYVQEGMALLSEGTVPALIENAGCLAGMPVGPLEVADAVSLELIYKVSLQTKADLGDSYIAPPGEQVITKMVKKLGRLGKKAGKGFFDYPMDAPKQLWFGLTEQFPQKPSAEQPDVDLVKKRLLYIQAIETARCLEENVVPTPVAADIGSDMGWGFAPHTGGVVSMIDTIGITTFVAECEVLAQKFGERFSPPKVLLERARNDQPFYPAI